MAKPSRPPPPPPGAKETTAALSDLNALNEPGEVESPAAVEPIDVLDEQPARTFARADVEVANIGRLEGYRLADVLHACAARKKTGILLLQRQAHQKKIFIDKGRPVFVQSSLQHETLGAYLLRTRAIDEDQHRKSVEHMQQTGKRQGEVLIAMGVLTPKQAIAHLNDHIRSKAVSAFAWSEGTYRFTEYPHLPQEVMVVEMDPVALVTEGLSSHFDPENLPIDFAAMDCTHAVKLDQSTYPEADIQLPDAIQGIRGDLEDGKAAEDIAHSRDVSMEHVMGVAYALYALQLVALTDRPTRPAAVERPESGAADEIRLAEDDLETVNEEIDAFLADYLRMRSLDCFALLEVQHDASDTDVAKAFASLSDRFHPERFGTSTVTDVGDKVTELWARIVRAHETLQTREGRDDYAASLDQPDESGSGWTLNRSEALTGEQHFQAGKSALAGEHYAEAAKAFAQALRRAPMEPSYLSHHGWALYLTDRESNREQAVEQLRTALSLDPAYGGAYFFLGRMAMMEGNDALAKSHFESAARSDPENMDAKRYVHVLAQRKKTTPAGEPARSGGRLRSLFRRK